MRATKAAFIVACLLALEGCASAAISVANMAGSAAVEHALTDPVQRIIPSSLAGARLAALRSVRRTGMTIVADERRDDRWVIRAKEENREVDIELLAIGDKRVLVSLEGSSGDFVITKNASTALEFIRRMGVELSRLTVQQIRIATAQMLLFDLGYDTKYADGNLDPKTRNAIRRFQRKTKTRADGKVSARLITMLRQRQAPDRRGAPLSIPGN